MKRAERVERFAWLPYEVRVLGGLGLAMPPMVLLVFGGVAALAAAGGAPPGRVARVVTAGLELGLPLAAGFVAATVVAHEDALELQLGLPTRYRTTVVRRLALLAIWVGLVAAATAAGAVGFGWRVVPTPFVVGQLAWLAPLLCFVAAGAGLALLTRSRSASAAFLGGMWVGQNLFAEFLAGRDWSRPVFLFATTYAPDAGFWLANRLSLVGIAVLVALGVWGLLNGGEALLAAEDA